MRRRFKRTKRVAAGLGAFVLLVWLLNTSWLAGPIGTEPYLVAHRGLGQGFSKEGLTGKTCTAKTMTPPEHGFLENTIPSMEAAFAYGADAVEFDVQPTTDGRFAVFHDWTLDCRTEGSGVTREQALADLQKLDVGYGYTPDGGATWPFRGKAVGLMPSLDEVLARFPDRDFVIDAKGNERDEADMLAERLAALPPERQARLAVTGGPLPVATVRERVPHVRTISRPQLKRCALRYMAIGWTGYVPEDCRRSLLTLPANVAPWMWGWPDRLLRRMDAVGTRVVLIGDYGGEMYSNAIDDPARIDALPQRYSGGIWTDRIDLIGPRVRGDRSSRPDAAAASRTE